MKLHVRAHILAGTYIVNDATTFALAAAKMLMVDVV